MQDGYTAGPMWCVCGKDAMLERLTGRPSAILVVQPVLQMRRQALAGASS